MNPERRAEVAVAVSFLVTAAAAVGLAVVYLNGGQPQLEGVLLAVAFSGLAYGFVTWGQKLMPPGPIVENRHTHGSPAGEVAEMEEDFERGVVGRRTLILRALTVAGGALGVAALFPIRSLGPSPGNALTTTPWRPGMRLVTDDGTPVLAAEVPLDGLVTVFPEGHAGSADGQAVLMRVHPRQIKPAPGRASWTPDGLVAYSKVCTHAGCPVGLYQADSHTLLCPCHQSAFDVLDHARPVFGPAAVSLPQLPLRLDGDGYVRAQGDFSAPVGPAFWRRK